MTSLVTYQSFLDKRGLLYHEYQWEGLEWCLRNENTEKMRGGIIADEMGLGKTLLMISTISFNIMLKTLIVVPPVLMNQWRQQIFMLTGHKPLVYHGLVKKNITIDDLINAPIVITTYHCISVSPKDPVAGLLHKIHWNRVIFDEAHHMRNGKTGVFLGAFNLRSKIRWFLSGTPLQNKIKDVSNLLTLLGHKGSMNVGNLTRLLEQKMMRRTKASVGLRMPELLEEKIVVDWSSCHEKDVSTAEDIHSSLSFSGVSLSKQESLGRFLKDGKRHLVAILRAKQVCAYPRLIYDYLEKRERTNKYKVYNGDQKLKMIVNKISERLDNGNGKIVFCQFRGEIDYLKEKLTNLGARVGVMDGRGKDSLENKYLILLLQIQSCCEGLNLQKDYSEIYFSTNQWNPTLEEQAIGRCFRLGQEKPVHVYKFLMDKFHPEEEGSEVRPLALENYIGNVQDKKKALVEEFLIVK